MCLGCVFIIYCYIANHHKLDVKTTRSYYLSVSVGQPSQALDSLLSFLTVLQSKAGLI